MAAGFTAVILYGRAVHAKAGRQPMLDLGWQWLSWHYFSR
jgi:hypothetical protein